VSIAHSTILGQTTGSYLLLKRPQERLASLHRMLKVWDGWISIGMLVDHDKYSSAVGTGLDFLRYGGEAVPAPERVALSLVQVSLLLLLS